MCVVCGDHICLMCVRIQCMCCLLGYFVCDVLEDPMYLMFVGILCV